MTTKYKNSVSDKKSLKSCFLGGFVEERMGGIFDQSILQVYMKFSNNTLKNISYKNNQDFKSQYYKKFEKNKCPPQVMVFFTEGLLGLRCKNQYSS